MPYNAPKTIADRVDHARNNTVPEGAGNITLTPSQYIPNWGFFDVDAFGQPVGMEVNIPPPFDGRMVFASVKDRGPDTLAAQLASPVPATESSWVGNQPWVAGPPPPPANRQANLGRPRTPTIQLVPSGIHGFNAGDYTLAWTRVDSKGRHTPPSPGVVVTVPTDGYSIRVTPPAGPHQGDTQGIGIWMSYKGADYSTITLQAPVINIAGGVPPTWLLSGPYQFGKRPAGFQWASAPTNNWTPWRFTEPGEFDIAGPMYYRIRTHFTLPNGRFTPMTNYYQTYVSETRKKTQWRLFPPYFPSWASGYRGFIGISKSSSGPWSWYLIYNVEWGDPLRPIPFQPGVTIKQIQASNYALVGGGAITNGEVENLNSKWRLLDATSYVTSSSSTVSLAPTQDPNNQGNDPTIMEIPDSPLEDPTTEGTQVWTPGKYWFSVANTDRGQIGPPSTPTRVTVGSGQVPRILFPSATNYFPNAEANEVDRSGTPYDHGISPGSGSITVGGGQILIATGGPLVSGAPKHTLLSEVLDTSLSYDLEERIDAVINSGTFTVWVEQYDAANTLLSRQALKAISQGGTYQISALVRAAVGSEANGVLLSDGSTITFATGLYKLQLSHEMSGAGFDQTITLSDITLSDADIGRPRRRAIPPVDSFDTADTNPPLDQPLAVTSQAAVEPPPQPPTYLRVASTNRLDYLDFENNALPPTGWTKFQSITSNTTFQTDTTSALSGTYGLHIGKNTSTYPYLYIARQFGTDTRNSIAVRFLFKPRDSQFQNLVTFTNDLPTSASDIDVGPTSNGKRLGSVRIYNQQIGIKTYNPVNGSTATSMFTTFNIGDLLDVEVVAKRDTIEGESLGAGSLDLYVGKNGAKRQLVGSLVRTNHWYTQSPRCVCFGLTGQLDAESFVDNYYDNVAVTLTGDTGTPGAAPITPINQPDRPSKPGIVLDTTDFEANSIPAAWTQTQTGTGTTLTVQASSAISGSYGLRVADTNNSTANTAYIERAIPGGTRNTVGFAESIRLVGLPSTGSMNVFGIGEAGGQQLVTASVDSSGNLYTQAFKIGGGSLTPLKQINVRPLVNGDVITIEGVPTNTGTLAGTVSVYVTIGGVRNLMYQTSALDWSASQAATVRAGIWGQSTNALTATLDIDNLITTANGTTVLRDTSADGTVINQAHAWIEDNIVATPNLFLVSRDPIAVVPGNTYTGAIQSKIKIRPNPDDPVLPYFMVAYRKDGARIELGSLAGDAGVTQSTGWVEYRRSFTIPDDCFEVMMESKNIVAGEYIAQEFVWVDGTPVGAITPEVSYPLPDPTTGVSGDFSVVFDRENPHGRLFSGIGVRRVRVAAVVDEPDGTSASAQYRTTSDPTLSTWSPFVSDPTLLPDGRWTQVKMSLTSADGSATPTVLAGSPIYEYALYGTNTQPIATLLREDGSELLGGVILADFSFDRSVSDWDIRKVRTGRSVAFRLSPPISVYPGFKILAPTVDAMREIEENCLANPWIVEARGKRAQVRFTEQIKFEEKPHTYKVYTFEETAVEQMYGEAKVGRVEVLELSDMAV